MDFKDFLITESFFCEVFDKKYDDYKFLGNNGLDYNYEFVMVKKNDDYIFTDKKQSKAIVFTVSFSKVKKYKNKNVYELSFDTNKKAEMKSSLKVFSIIIEITKDFMKRKKVDGILIKSPKSRIKLYKLILKKFKGSIKQKNNNILWMKQDLLENYLNLDKNAESDSVASLNMTSKLPNLGSKGLKNIGQLTRGFHLNTIIGRMLRVFTNAMLRSDSDKLKSAYDLFKNELSVVVHNLPYKRGRDIHSGKAVDVLEPSKDFLKDYSSDGDFLNSLDNALKISLSALPNERGQINNFINFLEIVRDEFLTIGEMLPTMGSFELEKSKDDSIKILNGKIKKYERLRNEF